MINFINVLKIQISYFYADCRIYWGKRGAVSGLQSILYAFTCHGWHIMFWFRLGKVIYAFPIPVISHALKILFQFNWFLITTFYGIWLDLSNNIGRGFYIGHYGGIVIRGDFGDFCSVGQCVTVGTMGVWKSNGHPVFGDNIYIGTGAKIIGDISIGKNVVVGSNCVVVKSIPEFCRAVGVPAKITQLDVNNQKNHD
jgi:serine O-acetyltransferase